MRKALWRCNSGHYFSEPNCPLDGWSFQGAQEVVEIIRQMHERGETPSIQQLREKGLGQGVLDRVIIVEFGGERSAFDGFAPEGYIIEGHYVPLRKVGQDYL